jgi:hypothetical protein
MGIQVPFWTPQPPISCPKNAPPIRQLWVMHPPRPLRWHESIVYYRAAGPSRLDDFGRRCHFRAAYGIHIIPGPRFALHRASTRHLWPATMTFFRLSQVGMRVCAFRLSISDEMHSGATRLDVGVKAETLDRFLQRVRARLGASGNSAPFRERAMRASNRRVEDYPRTSFY